MGSNMIYRGTDFCLELFRGEVGHENVYLGREFHQKAQVTVDQAVEVMLNARGLETADIGKPVDFEVSEQFLNVAANRVAALDPFHHLLELQAPKDFSDAAKVHEAALEITKNCLFHNPHINPRYKK